MSYSEILRLPKRRYDELIAILDWIAKEEHKERLEAEQKLRRLTP